MALRRTKTRNDDNQLNLFGYDANRSNHIDAVRPDSGETLARVPPENGAGNGGNGHAPREALRSAGSDAEGNGRPDRDADSTTLLTATSRDGSVGSSPAEIPPAATGRLRSLTPVRDAETVFNHQNYRITDGDKIGV